MKHTIGLRKEIQENYKMNKTRLTKKAGMFLFLITLVILSSGLMSAGDCTIKGYTIDDSGDGIGGATVHINTENPGGSYETTSDTETFLGYYLKGFTCEPGSTTYNIVAYNDSHYGEKSGTVSEETEYTDVVINQTFPEDTNPPKYFNVQDNVDVLGDSGRVVEGTDVETSVLWKDNVSNLGRISLYSNITGDPDYLYAVCDITDKNVSWCNRSIDVSGKAGETICWKQYGEDMRENKNETMVIEDNCFYVDYDFTQDSVKLESPEDGKTGLGAEVELSVNVTNPNGDNMDVSFYDSSGRLIGSESNVENGSSVTTTWSGLQGETNYEWYVNVSDDLKTGTSEMWSFTTKYIEPEDEGDWGGSAVFKPTKEELEEGYKKNFLKGWRIIFEIENKTYESEIRSVGQEGVSFVLNKEVLTMQEDETRKIDLNDDGYYDLKIESTNLEPYRGSGAMDMEFTSISEEIPSEEEPGQEEEAGTGREGEEPIKEDKSYWFYYLIGGIIIIGLVVWFVLRKKV